jgi:hypothetical protein
MILKLEKFELSGKGEEKNFDRYKQGREVAVFESLIVNQIY